MPREQLLSLKIRPSKRFGGLQLFTIFLSERFLLLGRGGQVGRLLEGGLLQLAESIELLTNQFSLCVDLANEIGGSRRCEVEFHEFSPTLAWGYGNQRRLFGRRP